MEGIKIYTKPENQNLVIMWMEKKKPLIEIQPKCPAHFFQAVFYRKDHII